MEALPPSIIAQIGSFLDDADRNTCRATAKMFGDIHAKVTDHRIVLRDYCSLERLTAYKCQLIARMKPALSHLTVVFKNLVGRPPLDPSALCAFQHCSIVELAFEYCDEDFMSHVLAMPWPCTMAYLWFHNGTTQAVPEELRRALITRKCPFATRFNAAQARSFLSDQRLVDLMQSVTYAVQSAHPAFSLDPHVIDLPTSIPDVHLDLRNYNVQVAHPERVRTIRFGAQWTIDNDVIQAHRERLCSWFNAETLKTNALESIEVFGLSLQDFHSAEKCFARHLLGTLKTLGSRCEVRFYNLLHHALLGLIRDFVHDVNISLVCKTPDTWLCAHLIQCFLHPNTICIIPEEYTPPIAWTAITNNVHALYRQLSPLLKSEWYWVNYTR